MKATLTNLSPLPREHWAVVTFPRPLAASFGHECTFQTNDGQRWRAVRGRTVGMKTVYRIRAYMGGNQTVQGRLVNARHSNAGDYQLHPWVTDDIGALLPSAGARVADVDRWDRDHTSPFMIDSSPAHTRWALRRWIPELGVIFEWWADLLHNDPVIPCWGKIVWSNRMDPAVNKGFQFFAIKSGEFIALDFAQRNGALTPLKDPHGQWGAVLNSQMVVLNDGAGIPLSGNMLAYRSPSLTDKPADPDDTQDLHVQGIANLHAGAHGPILGVCEEWDGHWLACGNVPRFRTGATPNSQAAWDAFVASQAQFGGWFANRPIGIGKTPGQTGAQEDFGATKGTLAVSARDPRWIRIAQYALQSELFRGFNHYEVNGVPLDLARHPDWVTWSGVTHFHPGVSSDRLNKEASAAPPGTGWYGYDDEHRSQNNQAAYMMLTDDPLMEDQLKHLVTTDRASYRMRFPNFGGGAARAQGRTSGAWAQFLAVTDGPEKQHWINMVATRMNASLHLNPAINVAGPMKVLAWGNPDGRKQVYDGAQLGRWTSFWEHGLAIVGIYNAVKQQPSNANAKEILLRICRTLVRFAFFKHSGTWYTVADCLWNDGEAPPGEMTPTNRALAASPGTDSVNTWTFAGLLVAREVLAGELEPARKAELDDYIQTITGGQEAGDQTTAEWWAIIRDIRFPDSAAADTVS
jgi:hypothetical protein